MEDRNRGRYLHFIYRNNNPVYLKEESILDLVKEEAYFEINGTNQTNFVESLNEFLNKNNDKKVFLIIDAGSINLHYQGLLSYLVKDRTYQNLFLPNNCKIIVTGDKDKVNKELLGLLVVVVDV